MTEEILGNTLLSLEVREIIANHGDLNEPRDGQTILDEALDLAGYYGDRLYGYRKCEDPLARLIMDNGGEPSEAIYQRELDEQLGWANQHYGCKCQMPFQHRFCK